MTSTTYRTFGQITQVTFRNPVPFLQAAATAGGRGVLGDEDGVVPHGGLLAVVGGLGRGETLLDEVPAACVRMTSMPFYAEGTPLHDRRSRNRLRNGDFVALNSSSKSRMSPHRLEETLLLEVLVEVAEMATSVKPVTRKPAMRYTVSSVRVSTTKIRC